MNLAEDGSKLVSAIRHKKENEPENETKDLPKDTEVYKSKINERILDHGDQTYSYMKWKDYNTIDPYTYVTKRRNEDEKSNLKRKNENLNSEIKDFKQKINILNVENQIIKLESEKLDNEIERLTQFIGKKSCLKKDKSKSEDRQRFSVSLKRISESENKPNNSQKVPSFNKEIALLEEKESYSDDNDRKNSINEYYSQLINIFNKYQVKTYVYGNDSKQIMNQFFEFYHKWIRTTIIDKLSNGTPFEELEKMGMNCLCVSINIINLVMDKMGGIFVLELFDHLSVFLPYSQTNAVARRMTEMILYCLSNYCDSDTIKKNRRIYITSSNKSCLEDCFRKFATIKIKLSSAIVICFLVFTNSELRRDARMYLNELKENILSNSNDKYLGIKKELILSALDKGNRRNSIKAKRDKVLHLGIEGEIDKTKINLNIPGKDRIGCGIEFKEPKIEVIVYKGRIGGENVGDLGRIFDVSGTKLRTKHDNLDGKKTKHEIDFGINRSGFSKKDKIPKADSHIDIGGGLGGGIGGGVDVPKPHIDIGTKIKVDKSEEVKKKYEILSSHFASLTVISNRNDNDRSSEQFRMLFIDGLSFVTNEDTLKSHFEQWGELVNVVVMRNGKNLESRGFGFVTYKDPEMVDAAQLNRPHIIDGRNVETKRVMPRDEANSAEARMTVKKLFVGALKKEVVADNLRDYFGQFGNIVKCEIKTCRETGDSRGFGFITFDDYDPVDKILLHKPHYIDKKRCEVKKALSKEGLGGGMGGGVQILKHHFDGVGGLGGGIGGGVNIPNLNIHLDKKDKGSMGVRFTGGMGGRYTGGMGGGFTGGMGGGFTGGMGGGFTGGICERYTGGMGGGFTDGMEGGFTGGMGRGFTGGMGRGFTGGKGGGYGSGFSRQF